MADWVLKKYGQHRQVLEMRAGCNRDGATLYVQCERIAIISEMWHFYNSTGNRVPPKDYKYKHKGWKMTQSAMALVTSFDNDWVAKCVLLGKWLTEDIEAGEKYELALIYKGVLDGHSAQDLLKDGLDGVNEVRGIVSLHADFERAADERT